MLAILLLTAIVTLELFLSNRYRQYGLWDRYTDVYPDEDLAYTVGISSYQTDWFFAQVNRCVFQFQAVELDNFAGTGSNLALQEYRK